MLSSPLTHFEGFWRFFGTLSVRKAGSKYQNMTFKVVNLALQHNKDTFLFIVLKSIECLLYVFGWLLVKDDDYILTVYPFYSTVGQRFLTNLFCKMYKHPKLLL